MSALDLPLWIAQDEFVADVETGGDAIPDRAARATTVQVRRHQFADNFWYINSYGFRDRN